MTIIEAIILGIVQGLTEFLPISSSGHLILLEKIFGIDGDFIFFGIAVHIATLLAVIIYLRKEVWYLIKNPFCSLARKLYLSVIPTIILVLIFENFITESFNGSLLPFCFVFTAVFLIVAQALSTKNICKKIDYKASLLMGFMQGIAVLPGISRSGSTICTGVIFGYDRVETAKFSFLMSIPVIMASTVYEIFKIYQNSGVGEIFPFQTVLASIFAFIVGILSIRFMLWAVKKIKFYYFAIYLLIISLVSFFFL